MNQLLMMKKNPKYLCHKLSLLLIHIEIVKYYWNGSAAFLIVNTADAINFPNKGTNAARPVFPAIRNFQFQQSAGPRGVNETCKMLEADSEAIKDCVRAH